MFLDTNLIVIKQVLKERLYNDLVNYIVNFIVIPCSYCKRRNIEKVVHTTYQLEPLCNECVVGVDFYVCQKCKNYYDTEIKNLCNFCHSYCKYFCPECIKDTQYYLLN